MSLESRSEDYERRVAAAGSTESIIGALVKGAERSKRTVMLLAISVVLDFVLSIAMIGLAWVAWQQAERVERNTFNLSEIVRNQCLQDVAAAQSTNTILRVLIVGAGDPGVFSPEEAKTRIARYTKSLVPIPKCDKN